MITYIVGAAIGFVINELINEDKIEKLKQQQAQPQVANPTIDGSTQINPDGNAASGESGGTPLGDGGNDEGKEVKFIAKSRGKKKPK